MSNINYDLNQVREQDLFNHNARASLNSGFSSRRDLKRAVKNKFDSFSCPECGSTKVNGSGVEVRYILNHLYEEYTKKGMLFSRSKKKKLGDRYEVENIIVKDGLIGLLAGQVKCSKCGWKIKEGSMTTWVAPRDLF